MGTNRAHAGKSLRQISQLANAASGDSLQLMKSVASASCCIYSSNLQQNSSTLDLKISICMSLQCEVIHSGTGAGMCYLYSESWLKFGPIKEKRVVKGGKSLSLSPPFSKGESPSRTR